MSMKNGKVTYYSRQYQAGSSSGAGQVSTGVSLCVVFYQVDYVATLVNWTSMVYVGDDVLESLNAAGI